MHPELFTIPGVHYSVKSYGFCVMLGFLTAAWFAMRRAARTKCDPDLVLNISFVGLIAGLVGSRLFYVIHYWQRDFADAPNKLWAVLNITAGGFEFLGAVIGAVPAVAFYLWRKRESMRVYLDIMAPGLMWGLAFGRVGCFMNGCCFGGPTDAAWAVRFPYGSPAFVRHWEKRQVHVPAELILDSEHGPAGLLPAASLNLALKDQVEPLRKQEELEQLEREMRNQLNLVEESGDADAVAEAKSALKKVALDRQRLRVPDEVRQLRRAQVWPSREHPERFPFPEFDADTPRTSVSELQVLAAPLRSLPVHPVQLYATIHAFILSGLLSAVFYARKRHGVVFGLMLVTYPIGRMFEEMIRIDNPRDTVGLTVSQFVGLVILGIGAVYLYVLYRRLPERSPYARAYVPPEEPSSAG